MLSAYNKCACEQTERGEMKVYWVRHGMKRLSPLIALLVILVFIKNNIGQAAYIPSKSMMPTLEIHDVLIIDKTIPPSDLKRGDIVVFRNPFKNKRKKFLIKRLIGLPGDRIEIRQGKLYRNGHKVKEEYIKEPMKYRMKAFVVPKGKYFFLGDNRNVSYDAHVWQNKYVNEEAIIGKAVYRIFPFSRMEDMRLDEIGIDGK